jgi:hypothetical protein
MTHEQADIADAIRECTPKPTRAAKPEGEQP